MTVRLRYFAAFREICQLDQETYCGQFKTVADLYELICKKYQFTLNMQQTRPAINDRFCAWDNALQENDLVVFIPPVAGG